MDSLVLTAEEDLRVQDDLAARRHELAEAVVSWHDALRPERAVHDGARGRQHCLKDTLFHLDYLAEAVAAESVSLFSDYVQWATLMLESRGIPRSDLALSLTGMQAVLQNRLSTDAYAKVAPVLAAGLRTLGPETAQRIEAAPASDGLSDGLPADGLTVTARAYLAALLDRDVQEARSIVFGALHGGASVQDICLQVFEQTQHRIGWLWQAGRVSVAQEHLCTATTQRIMAELYPQVFTKPHGGRTAVIACVSGDLHELGARMVADFLEMDGWSTHYLGASTPETGIAEVVASERADVLALSCTLTPHLPALRSAIACVRKSAAPGLRVVVGGYPFNVDGELWRRVGADASAGDARAAVQCVAAGAL